jgi:hypothetical protein
MPSAKNPTLSRQTIIHITFTRGRLPATALQCCIIYATSLHRLPFAVCCQMEYTPPKDVRSLIF